MRLDDFNDIDLNNAGDLPYPVKMVLLGILFAIIVALGYWFLWRNVSDEIDQATAHETELKNTYTQAAHKAAKVKEYKAQMVDMEKTFGELLRQLPDKTQIANLLTDINKAGLSNGLEFELFKPGDEIKSEFYAEIPIQIKVMGGYANLGAFTSDVAKLSRIVTLNDVVVSIPPKDAVANKDNKVAAKENRLVLETVAKTYRYLDEAEIKEQAEIAAKKAIKP